MSLVRSASLNQSTSGSISRTFSTHAGGAPASGNLLVACVSTAVIQGSHTPPSGWTVIQECPPSTGQTWAAWAYKVCTGTEDAITWAFGTNSASTLVITEWNDGFNTLDDSNEDETDLTTVATTFDTGSATATETTGLALAFFGADSGRKVDGGRAYNNSFVEDVASFAAAADRGGVFLASKAISGTGSYSCQYTTTDGGDRGYGSIALFVTPSGGGFQSAWARGANVVIKA